MLPNPKLGSVSGNGQTSKNQLIRFLMTLFLFNMKTLNAILSLLGGLIGVKLLHLTLTRYAGRNGIREEKLDEGAIAYFQEEEEERQYLQMNLEENETTSKQDSIKNQAAESVSISCSSSSSSSANEIPNSTAKPRLWLINPSRPYLFGQEFQEIIDLTGSPNSDDDFFMVFEINLVSF